MFSKYALLNFWVSASTLLFSSNSIAQVTTSSQMNNLRITNRAQCAIDSDYPTASAFLILDGYNAGKLGNSLAKNIGLDEAQTSQDTMKEFRLSVSHLTLTIINKIMTGKLPLLPMNLKVAKLYNYTSLANSCGDKVYCAELQNHLAKIWALSENSAITSVSPEWKKIDNFSASNFMSQQGSRRVGCYYLKRFSPLQGQLHNTTLDTASLQEMAVAFLEQEKYITSCYDTDASLDSRNAALQIDIKTGELDSWNAKGFDFWNSVKIYLSWAWRNTDVVNHMSPRFGEVFKSVALEESMMLIPNGCKSITKPSCDSEHLALNNLRELAKQDTKDSGFNTEVPQSPDKTMLERGARAVNNDFLNTKGYMSAGEWVENFRKNFVQTRGSAKNRLQSSVQFMNILADTMTADTLVEFVKPIALASKLSSLQRDELYYLCTEVRLAGDKRLDFMKSDIDGIAGLKNMNKALDSSKRSIEQFVAYFDVVSKGILPYCDQLEKTNIWQAAGYTVNKSGFKSWAKEVLSTPTEETPSTFQPQIYGAPLLVWNSSLGAQEGNVICASGVDCARGVIKAMVDLYAVAQYADAFLPISSTAASPDVFNPYSELKACKIYDPWYQSKRANRVFMADLASTALFGWNFMPIYIDADYTPPKVTSFQRLLKDGVIKFDANIEKSKMVASLLADFGPLTGAPCAVSIAPNAKTFNFLAFDGISVNYCDSKSTGGAIANGANNISTNPEKTRSYCGGCSINFVGVGSAASVTSAATSFNPIKMGVYLFRAIYRFVNAKKDPVNVPMSYNVDLAKVADAYRRYGTIPKDCVNQLGQGLKCFQDICSAKAADFFERLTGGKVTTISIQDANGHNDNGFSSNSYQRRAWVKSDLCTGETVFNFSCRENGSGFYVGGTDGNMWGASGSCKKYIREGRWK
ncbi:hypothetical protein [Bdellovibrio svalbardensis]|uniref:Uncharacterized protein n=1 Tax=Bdellovibrio svalbardensis TaxID=2972972 RepID=A0ABT6DF33_9BACT|nr:hypothetical protein [Bdellovibrio svalbardensis]MDG0814895.1 hypothetical protein [Bdellovibrio svalbardensis]